MEDMSYHGTSMWTRAPSILVSTLYQLTAWTSKSFMRPIGVEDRKTYRDASHATSVRILRGQYRDSDSGSRKPHKVLLHHEASAKECQPLAGEHQKTQDEAMKCSEKEAKAPPPP